MNRRLSVLTLALAAAPLALAQLDPIPRPLSLPPGLVEVLTINHDQSYMADSVRIADCPLGKDNPFGTYGNVQFGGVALYASQLSDMVQIQFFQPSQGIAHFEITLPKTLVGDDVPMVAPQFFSFQTRQNTVFDAFQQVSSGDLNLQTGEVTNLIFAVNMFNTFYQAFGNANPRVKLEYFQFPGAFGSAWAQFTQRPDGLLDLELHGTTFLPLGNSIDGDYPRIPLPFCDSKYLCSSIQAPGSSFRPSINLNTAASLPDPLPGLPQYPDCGANCIDIPYNTVQQYTNNTFYSFFHEGFTMNVPQLGGIGIGRTQWDGHTVVQFGQRTGDLVPVFFELLAPSGTIGVAPKVKTTLPLPDGVTVGFIGKDIILHFPILTYFPTQMSYSSDPFDGSRGLLNVKTGKFVERLMFSGFLVHNVLLRVIEQNNGRIPLSPFLTRGVGSFMKGPHGESIFRYASLGYRNYTGFFFPNPDLLPADAWLAGPGSRLDPHLYIQSVQTAAGDNPGPVVKSGSYNVVTAGGDPVTMSYSVPCNAVGQTGTFEYANTGSPVRSGSFHMQNLVYVSCTNSPTSTAAPGDYDTITFSGIGLWSNDPLQLDPHVAAVHVYPNSPQGPYFSVLIDGGVKSNADLKPPIEPIP